MGRFAFVRAACFFLPAEVLGPHLLRAHAPCITAFISGVRCSSHNKIRFRCRFPRPSQPDFSGAVDKHMQAIQERDVPIVRARCHRWLMRIHCQFAESNWISGLVQSDSDMRVEPMCAHLGDTVNQQPKPKFQSKCKVTLP